MSTIIVNCGEIAHLSVGDISEPISGYEMLDKKSLVFPKGNAILIKNGNISSIDQNDIIYLKTLIVIYSLLGWVHMIFQMTRAVHNI